MVVNQHVIASKRIIPYLHDHLLTEGVDPGEGAPIAVVGPVTLAAVARTVVGVAVLAAQVVTATLADRARLVAVRAADEEVVPLKKGQ